MANLNIVFNGKRYLIEQSAIKTMVDNLKNYISTNMAGTGTFIQLDGQMYEISSTKYSGIVNNFVSYLGTITGDGKVKVTVDGTEYSIDSDNMNKAIINIEDTLEEVANSIMDKNILLSSDNYVLMDKNGIYLITKEEN